MREQDRPRSESPSPWLPVRPNARRRVAKRHLLPKSSRPLPRRRRRTTRPMRRRRSWRRWCCDLASSTGILICWPTPVDWRPRPNGSCDPPRAFRTWMSVRRPVRRIYSPLAVRWPEAVRSAWRRRCHRYRSVICLRTTRTRPLLRSTGYRRVSIPFKRRMLLGPHRMITPCRATSVDLPCYWPRALRCCPAPVHWPPCRHRWPRPLPRPGPPRTNCDGQRRRRANDSRCCVAIYRPYLFIPCPSNEIATRASRLTSRTADIHIYLLITLSMFLMF